MDEATNLDLAERGHFRLEVFPACQAVQRLLNSAERPTEPPETLLKKLLVAQLEVVESEEGRSEPGHRGRVKDGHLREHTPVSSASST